MSSIVHAKRFQRRGAITLLLLLVLPTVIGLLAVLIDYTVVRSAHMASLTHARQVGRSLLAQYDASLYDYGLFGVQLMEDSAQQAWDAMRPFVLEKALWRSVRTTTVRAQGLYPLADHRFFSRQILDTMKIAIFAHAGIEFAQKWQTMQAPVTAALASTEHAARITALVQRREAALERLWTDVGRWVRAAAAAVATDSEARLASWLEQLRTVDQLEASITALHKSAATALPPAYVETVRLDLISWVALYQAKTDWAKTASELLVWYAQQQQAHKERTRAPADPIAKPQPIATTCRTVPMDTYRQLHAWEDAYTNTNAHIATYGTSTSLDPSDVFAFVQQTLGMLRIVSEWAQSVRDELLLHEYVLSHMTFRTQAAENVPLAVQHVAHTLTDHEAEYVLYGLPSCTLNLAAAQAEVIALRTALHIVKELTTKVAPTDALSPWAWIARVVSAAFAQAHIDTEQLLRGQLVDTPLIPALRLSYKDHLRLFFVFHRRDMAVVHRVQSVISLNTGIDLHRTYSAIDVDAVSIVSTLLRTPFSLHTKVVAAYE
ncbi:MAG: hypothetical protein KGO83_04065 [Paenibacillaceae bacterium]|nr:hypothetical protein [Paenibacillaceae bacterium]